MAVVTGYTAEEARKAGFRVTAADFKAAGTNVARAVILHILTGPNFDSGLSIADAQSAGVITSAADCRAAPTGAPTHLRYALLTDCLCKGRD